MNTRKILGSIVALALILAWEGVPGQNIESPVEVIEGLEPVDLGYGQYTVGAEVNSIGDSDPYLFFGEAGDVVDVNITAEGSQEMFLYIYEPDGVVLDTNWTETNGDDFRTRVTLRKRGPHTLVARETHDNEIGPYTLQLERLPQAPSRPELHRLYYGAARFADVLSPHCDTDTFFFQAIEGTRVRIVLTVLDEFEGHLEIWSRAGTRFVRNYTETNGDDFVTEFVVPATDDYFVLISETHLNESGRYDLTLQCLDGPCPEITPAVYQIVDAGPNCVFVRLINNVPVRGGELSLGYPSSLISNVAVTPVRPALPDAIEDDEVAVVTGIPLTGCPADPAIDRGLTIHWLDQDGGDVLLQPGRRELFQICFTPAPGTDNDTCPELKFLSCLGPAGSPIQNLVTHQLGGTVVAETLDSRTCFTVNTPFRRGDVNGDGRFDVSDAISILICRFLDIGCSRCQDASDVNDDGQVDISDAIHHLNWRFQGGPQPAAPFPGCGTDPTPIALCVEPACI